MSDPPRQSLTDAKPVTLIGVADLELTRNPVDRRLYVLGGAGTLRFRGVGFANSCSGFVFVDEPAEEVAAAQQLVCCRLVEADVAVGR